MTEKYCSPDSAIRPLREDEVVALHDYADTGGLLCDCDGSPELCHCSTIMMLCDEWRAMRASVKPDVAQAAPTPLWRINLLCEQQELYTKDEIVGLIQKISSSALSTAPQGAAVTDALYESAYIAGLNLGYSLGLENNHAKLNEVIAARDGYLSALSRPEQW